MKILFVNTSSCHGGAARAAMRIMRGVQQNGVDAEMLVLHKGTSSEDVKPISNFIPRNMLYRICDWIAHKVKNKWQYFKWKPYKRTKQDAYMSDLRGTRVHGAFQKIDYDIVHLHWINERFLDIRELKKIHKPIVWTLHDSWAFCGVCHYFVECEKYQTHCGTCPMLGSKKERDLAYEVFEKKLVSYKDLDLHIVTPSRWLGECAKKSALLGRFPVHVIPNCIDTDLFRPILDKSAGRPKPLILYGAMNAASDSRKGFAYLLKALQLLDQQGIEAKLAVFGADQQDLPMAFKHIEVLFLGYVNDNRVLADVYTQADVMVVPSLNENLSNTIMESLSCGTPVVGFDIGGNSDMIDHKQNGYLAAERDCDDLARGIEWCLTSNTDGAMSKKAREKVMKNFTIEIVSEQYKRFYESII